MSREIKFRAWSLERGMINELPSEALIIDENEGTLICGRNLSNGDWEEPILMQFTGLKDKKGKDIYEGDVVKADWREGNWEIVFADGGFMMNIIPDSHAQVFIQNEEVQIIGNIHENSDLINNKQ